MILTLPFWVYFAVLKIHIHQVKREVKHKIIDGIDKSELELLGFTHKEAINDLRWEHSKEFEYRGEMYDIVEKRFTKDSVYYWCWWDKEETQLNRQLFALMGVKLGDDPIHHKNKNQYYTFFDNLYYNQKEVSEEFKVDKGNNFFRYEFSIIEYRPQDQLPPPKFS